MGEKWSDRLPLWILPPLLLLAAVVVAALSLPEVECGGEETEAGVDGAVLVALVVFSAVATVAAGLFRLVTMTLRRQYGSRDAWILLAALLVVAVTGVAYAPAQSFAAGVAIGGLALTGLALLALVVAALARKRVEAVGILLPIYLFGAAFAYLGAGALGLLVSSGIGC
jgi:hypothetical protein